LRSLQWSNRQLIKNGFSLIEYCIALTIFCFLSLITLFNWSLLQSAMARIEINQLYSACEFVQQYAMAQSTAQSLTFDQSSGSYSYLGRTHYLPYGISFGAPQGAKGPPATQTQPIQSAITFSKQQILYSENGVISAGSVYIKDSLGSCGYALSSPVAQYSHLRKYYYKDNSWIYVQ